jgi:hypothetical protein
MFFPCIEKAMNFGNGGKHELEKSSPLKIKIRKTILFFLIFRNNE